MATISLFSYLLLLISFSQATINDDNGFTTSLFHRDSLFQISSLSHYDRLTNAFQRSFSRSTALINHVATVATTTAAVVQSPIGPGSGEYLMYVSIGTPPVDYIGIADTGSDLIWTQCLPCQKCFNQSRPIFNPLKSSSYHRVSCTSQSCHALNVAHCGVQGICNYSYTYGDQTYTKGDLGFDKITIGSSSVNSVIGCGHESGGGFGYASGVIGLGGGELSLVSQMSQTAAISQQFSYCLPTLLSHANGKINFGQNAIISGPGVVSTPLVPKNPKTYYYMTLEAISIGNERHVADMSSKQGNMIIDSGTTLTILPKELYDGVVSSLLKVVRARRVEDPGHFLGLCFADDSNSGGLGIPIITAHFAGGADVKLLPENTFMKVAKNVSCSTLTSAEPRDGFGILGNLAQANFLIGYDLEARRLSFKPTICA
ncbi:aspartic proteinase CDR1-like [Benincasa hispida]|uniref:aspartic proteinase CDR1-like n=1 Tax=Benincasa hispida TaxID=102211 RepID=UPI001902BC35|nr:aspartic proteinase CDR1-like [Benincasa hispida]